MQSLSLQSLHDSLAVYRWLRFPLGCCAVSNTPWSGRFPDYDAAARELVRRPPVAHRPAAIRAAARRPPPRRPSPHLARLALGVQGSEHAVRLVRSSGHAVYADEPWPLLWRALAEALPNARFVLWGRDASQWSASMRDYFRCDAGRCNNRGDTRRDSNPGLSAVPPSIDPPLAPSLRR